MRSASSASASAFAPLIVALPLALVVIIAGFFSAPLRREVPKRAPKPMRATIAYRWSRLIQHRPWPAVILGLLILVLLAAAVLRLRLGFSDDGNYPTDTTTRQAYDLLAEGFGPGFNGPLVLVADAARRDRPGGARARSPRPSRTRRTWRRSRPPA